MGRSNKWNSLVDQMGLGLEEFQGDEGVSETEPATRQDSLDIYNKSEAHLQGYLDDGYTISRNEPLEKNRTEYYWTDKELPDLPDEVWAELKGLWSTFFEKLTNPEIAGNEWTDEEHAAYVKERDNLYKIYNDRARAIQEQYGLEDPPRFAAVRQKEPDTWIGDKRIPGEERVVDHTAVPVETRGAPKTVELGTRHAPFGHRSVQDIDKYRYLQGDMRNNVVNPNMPLGYYDRRIEPVNRISLEKMVPDATGAMVPDYVDLNSYNSLDEELGLPVDPNQMFGPPVVLPIPDSEREKFGLINPFIEPLEPLGIPEINLERPDGLMESNISLPKPGRKPVLIHKRNHKMRTGQEPDHYVYYDSKGNPKVRPVEPEELEYYRKENRIRNPQRITASFKDGGALPEYQPGGGNIVKNTIKKIIKTAPRSFDNLNSLYRVVDVPLGSSIDEIAKAAIYGTTIPSMPTIGRRTGYSDIQKNTPFDVLNTTNSQNWIAGEGLGDRNSLINLYGGNNPYVVKMSRENPFADPETLTSINNRTDILKNFRWPYTGNVGKWNPTTGQHDLPLDLGEGVFTTVGKNADELAKIRPGSIVNPNYLSRGDNNITTIFGPKGMQVRQPQEIISAKDYFKRMTDNPNFTYKEGGALPKAQLGKGIAKLFNPAGLIRQAKATKQFLPRVYIPEGFAHKTSVLASTTPKNRVYATLPTNQKNLLNDILHSESGRRDPSDLTGSMINEMYPFGMFHGSPHVFDTPEVGDLDGLLKWQKQYTDKINTPGFYGTADPDYAAIYTTWLPGSGGANREELYDQALGSGTNTQLYNFKFADDAKIKTVTGSDISSVDPKERIKFLKQGYDAVVGRGGLNRSEFLILNEDKLKDFYRMPFSEYNLENWATRRGESFRSDDAFAVNKEGNILGMMPNNIYNFAKYEDYLKYLTKHNLPTNVDYNMLRIKTPHATGVNVIDDTMTRENINRYLREGNVTNIRSWKKGGEQLPEYQPGGGNILKNAIKRVLPTLNVTKAYNPSTATNVYSRVMPSSYYDDAFNYAAEVGFNVESPEFQRYLIDNINFKPGKWNPEINDFERIYRSPENVIDRLANRFNLNSSTIPLYRLDRGESMLSTEGSRNAWAYGVNDFPHSKYMALGPGDLNYYATHPRWGVGEHRTLAEAPNSQVMKLDLPKEDFSRYVAGSFINPSMGTYQMSRPPGMGQKYKEFLIPTEMMARRGVNLGNYQDFLKLVEKDNTLPLLDRMYTGKTHLGLWSNETMGATNNNLENKIWGAHNLHLDPNLHERFLTSPLNEKHFGQQYRSGQWGYKDGGDLPKAQFGKWIDGIKDRQDSRRIDRTPIRDANSSDLLDMLTRYKPEYEGTGDDPRNRMGHYDPKEKEIVIWRDNAGDDYDDTVKHEQIHASQYRPLQRLATFLDFQDSPRIRDRKMRKAYKELNQGDNVVDYSGFNDAGRYVLDNREEFESVLDTGVNAAKELGVDFSGSFDDIFSQLSNIENPTNNMTGLTKFMDNKYTQNQKDIIFQAIRDDKHLQSLPTGEPAEEYLVNKPVSLQEGGDLPKAQFGKGLAKIFNPKNLAQSFNKANIAVEDMLAKNALYRVGRSGSAGLYDNLFNKELEREALPHLLRGEQFVDNWYADPQVNDFAENLYRNIYTDPSPFPVFDNWGEYSNFIRSNEGRVSSNMIEPYRLNRPFFHSSSSFEGTPVKYDHETWKGLLSLIGQVGRHEGSVMNPKIANSEMWLNSDSNPGRFGGMMSGSSLEYPINITRKGFERDPQGLFDIGAHEKSHWYIRGDALVPKVTNRWSNFVTDDAFKIIKESSKTGKHPERYDELGAEYLQTPVEVQARVTEIRGLLSDMGLNNAEILRLQTLGLNSIDKFKANKIMDEIAGSHAGGALFESVIRDGHLAKGQGKGAKGEGIGQERAFNNLFNLMRYTPVVAAPIIGAEMLQEEELSEQKIGGEIKKHTIVRGDTGKTLFEKYGVTASDIKEHNNIKFFAEGREIEIPSRELPKAQDGTETQSFRELHDESGNVIMSREELDKWRSPGGYTYKQLANYNNNIAKYTPREGIDLQDKTTWEGKHYGSPFNSSNYDLFSNNEWNPQSYDAAYRMNRDMGNSSFFYQGKPYTTESTDDNIFNWKDSETLNSIRDDINNTSISGMIGDENLQSPEDYYGYLVDLYKDDVDKSRLLKDIKTNYPDDYLSYFTGSSEADMINALRSEQTGRRPISDLRPSYSTAQGAEGTDEGGYTTAIESTASTIPSIEMNPEYAAAQAQKDRLREAKLNAFLVNDENFNKGEGSYTEFSNKYDREQTEQFKRAYASRYMPEDQIEAFMSYTPGASDNPEFQGQGDPNPLFDEVYKGYNNQKFVHDVGNIDVSQGETPTGTLGGGGYNYNLDEFAEGEMPYYLKDRRAGLLSNTNRLEPENYNRYENRDKTFWEDSVGDWWNTLGGKAENAGLIPSLGHGIVDWGAGIVGGAANTLSGGNIPSWQWETGARFNENPNFNTGLNAGLDIASVTPFGRLAKMAQSAKFLGTGLKTGKGLRGNLNLLRGNAKDLGVYERMMRFDKANPGVLHSGVGPKGFNIPSNVPGRSFNLNQGMFRNPYVNQIGKSGYNWNMLTPGGYVNPKYLIPSYIGAGIMDMNTDPNVTITNK